MDSNQTKKYGRVLTTAEQEERMKIIRSGAIVSRYVTDTDNYVSFSTMKPETARRLISEGFANPEDSQNDYLKKEIWEDISGIIFEENE